MTGGLAKEVLCIHGVSGVRWLRGRRGASAVSSIDGRALGGIIEDKISDCVVGMGHPRNWDSTGSAPSRGRFVGGY